ncbi:MAG: hypothetical protein JNL57_10800 [Bacteroidetes bacterium]|nr:hypothetical protein [Bacteroidota bacterium]
MITETILRNTSKSLGITVSHYESSKFGGKKLEFLNKWIKEFNYYAKKYVDVTNGDTPYLWTEREMNGALLIALSNFTDACISETSTRRKNGARKIADRTDRHGRVDFWARFGIQDFYIESKHSYVARNSKLPNKDVLLKQGKLFEQLHQSIETNEFNTDTSKVYHLAIQTVVLKTKNKATQTDFTDEDWNQLIKNYYQMDIKFGKRVLSPNWLGIIKFSDQVVQKTKREYEKDSWHYHGLIFIATYI